MDPEGLPRVCYTEDMPSIPEDVIEVLKAFGFGVDHFWKNSAAWREIDAHPEQYAALIVDNDTGDKFSGMELIERTVSHPGVKDRLARGELLIIVLSSSNSELFETEGAVKLREAHGVQLCWKPDTCYLQAEYLRYRLDTGQPVSFADWLQETRGLDLGSESDQQRILKENIRLYSRVWEGFRYEGTVSRGKER